MFDLKKQIVKNTAMTQSSQSFDFPVRVYYEDTDAVGIVYHGNYVKYMERGRTEMLRQANIQLSEVAAEHAMNFVVGEIKLRYKASARLDDYLIVRSRVTAVGNASLTMEQNIFKRIADTESLLLEGSVSLVFITREGKPVRIPDFMRDALAPYFSKETI